MPGIPASAELGKRIGKRGEHGGVVRRRSMDRMRDSHSLPLSGWRAPAPPSPTPSAPGPAALLGTV